MIKAKIRGFQITTSLRFEPCAGLPGFRCVKREVFYAKDLEEITIDTNKGSFIITKNDLVELMKRKMRWQLGEKREKIVLSVMND